MISAAAASGTSSVQMIPPTSGQKLYLRGWAAQEDTGTSPARVQLLDAQGGNQIVPLTLGSNESFREFVPVENELAEGIYIATGAMWLQRLSGTTTVTVYYALERQ